MTHTDNDREISFEASTKARLVLPRMERPWMLLLVQIVLSVVSIGLALWHLLSQ